MNEGTIVSWQDVCQSIRDQLGDDAVYTGEACIPYAADRWARGEAPPAVFLPRNPEQTARIARTLYEAGLPFVARGLGTGMSGGALPLGKAAVVSFERMTRIAAHPESLTLEAEPGALLKDIQTAAAAHGLMYPPDPASAEECSIGGNIAENAGGLSCVKYGVTGDFVLALDIVLPDGRTLVLGSRARKDVAGLDLKRLIIGSEGTLALITGAVLRLVPQPQASVSFAVWFRDAASAVESLRKLMQSGVTPARAELIASACLTILANEGVPVPDGAGALLLLSLDGSPAAIRAEREAAAIVLGAQAIRMETASREDEERLWNIRTRLSPAMKKLAPIKINLDIAVPLDRQAEFIAFAEDLAAARGRMIAIFGHAGDGNLHVNILLREEEYAGAHDFADIIFRQAVALGGTITGEHGVGIAKSDWLGLRLDPLTLDLCRAIKKLFDPKNLLNPGKAYYPGPDANIERLI
ncbi:MAG: FAD-binding protein [Spirochaetota bacterium]|jgi:D-lactate dehydrogenase|nr:FAD-binding protein [Spirochaetota bacterium]